MATQAKIPPRPSIGATIVAAVTGESGAEALIDDGIEDLIAQGLDPVMRNTTPGKNRVVQIILWIVRAPVALAASLPESLRGLVAAPTVYLLEKIFLGRLLAGDSASRSIARLLIRNGLLAVIRKAGDIADDRAREGFIVGETDKILGIVKFAVAQVVLVKGDLVAHRPYMKDGKIVMKSGGGGGGKEGKGGGNHVPQVICPVVVKAMIEHDAREVARAAKNDKHRPAPFEMELADFEMAEAQGRDECPTCKPYTIIHAAEEAAKEAEVSTAPHDAAGHPAPAKPEPKKDEPKAKQKATYTEVALAFIAAFGRSVEVSEADEANEVFEARPDLVERMAREWFLDHTDEVPKYDEHAKLDEGQERKLKAHRKLTDEEKLGFIRNLFVSGAAKPDKNPLLKMLLDRLLDAPAQAKKEAEAKKAQSEAKTAEDELKDAKATVKEYEDARSAMLMARSKLGVAKASGDAAKIAAAQDAFDNAEALYDIQATDKDVIYAQLEAALKAVEEAKKASKTAEEALEPKKKEEKSNPWPRRFAIMGITATILLMALTLIGVWKAMGHH